MQRKAVRSVRPTLSGREVGRERVTQSKSKTIIGSSLHILQITMFFHMLDYFGQLSYVLAKYICLIYLYERSTCMVR